MLQNIFKGLYFVFCCDFCKINPVYAVYCNMKKNPLSNDSHGKLTPISHFLKGPPCFGGCDVYLGCIMGISVLIRLGLFAVHCTAAANLLVSLCLLYSVFIGILGQKQWHPFTVKWFRRIHLKHLYHCLIVSMKNVDSKYLMNWPFKHDAWLFPRNCYIYF